jgi:type II secretion system protein I
MGDRPHRRPGDPEAGFTLVEMLVALLLLALVGLTLVRFQTFQLAGAGAVQMQAAAQLEADNRAIALAVQPEVPTVASAGTSENAGRTWYWRVATAPPPDPASMPDLVRLDLSIATSADGPPIATRTLLRPIRIPAEMDG